MNSAQVLVLASLLPLLLIGACKTAPTELRLQLSVGSDVPQAAQGPVQLTIFSGSTRIVDDATVHGTLPGDVVVLLDDDVTAVRLMVRVDTNGSVASAAVRAPITAHRRTLVTVTLTAGALADVDGDGVPDAIDDCPSIPDADQKCAHTDDPDMATNGLSCGNGTLDPGEDCDEGSANSDATPSTATCTSLCRKRTPCGTLIGSTAATIDAASGHCYVLWPGPLNFTAAENDCNLRGGHLASIGSEAEDAYVRSLTLTQPAWIGLVLPPVIPPFTWTSGEVGAYAGFATPPAPSPSACATLGGPPIGWTVQRCGWASSGDQPVTPIVAHRYVCEHSCGNGIVDEGEECDGPSATCTAMCRNKRPCTESGGQVSAATGRCYFKAGTAATYVNTLASACPAGTHVATPVGPADNDAARLATDVDAWLAVRATTTVGMFAFEGSKDVFDPSRYHAFVAIDPDAHRVPICVVMTHANVDGDGWRDRDCDELRPAVCERD